MGPWADRLVDLASHAAVKEVLAFFNNHRRGQAARNAQMFEAMLATRFPPEALGKIVPAAPREGEVLPLFDADDPRPHA